MEGPSARPRPPHGLAIRDAEPRDDLALARLLIELGHTIPVAEIGPRRERFLAEAGARILVAELDGVVCAFAAITIMHPLQRDRPVAYVTALAVAPGVRRRGVGRALLAAVERASREAGCGHASLTSAEHRAGAHAFYPSAGWPLTGRRFGRELG